MTLGMRHNEKVTGYAYVELVGYEKGNRIPTLAKFLSGFLQQNR